MNSLIKLIDINKIVGKEYILKDINLEVYPGEFLSIIGPSGSGKSSLLYILGLLDKPTSGLIVIEGKEIDFSDNKHISLLRNNKFGFIFQFHYLINELTLYEKCNGASFEKGSKVKCCKRKGIFSIR